MIYEQCESCHAKQDEKEWREKMLVERVGLSSHNCLDDKSHTRRQQHKSYCSRNVSRSHAVRCTDFVGERTCKSPNANHCKYNTGKQIFGSVEKH